MSEHPASCGCPMHGPGPDMCDGCGHPAHQPQCCTHRSLSGGASGMVQVCACGRGMVGDPTPREPRYRTLADRQWAEQEPPQTRWEMTRGYGTY